MCWRTVPWRCTVRAVESRCPGIIAGLLQLLGNLAMERTSLPLLRCYWYEATVEGRRTADHDTLADLPGVKLRVAKMRPGRREGVESEIHRDLTTLARNKAVSDAMVVSAEEDLAQVIADVQDMGMRVTLLHIDRRGQLGGVPRAPAGVRRHRGDQRRAPAALRRADLRGGAAAPGRVGSGLLALRPVINGNGHHVSSANGKVSATGRIVGYAPQRPGRNSQATPRPRRRRKPRSRTRASRSGRTPPGRRTSARSRT